MFTLAAEGRFVAAAALRYRCQRPVCCPSVSPIIETVDFVSGNGQHRIPSPVTLATRHISLSPSALTMDYDKVKSGLESKALTLIDVRSEKERKEHGAIPGSKHVHIDELAEAFKLDVAAFQAKYGFSKPDPEKDAVATHCMMGGRAGKAATALKEMGYTKAESYGGSFKDWVAKGGPVDK